MKITAAELQISAVDRQQYPKDGLPEIALAGRSNVGKSSFINHLLGRKKLVRTSSSPGKTQTLNFYKINQQFYMVDVPGYGYAKVSKQERARWGGMMEEYFHTRDTLRLTVLVTDIRHAPTDDDQQMYMFLKYLEMDVLVIATKADKLAKGKIAKAEKQQKQTLHLEENDALIPFSAHTGLGKDKAWSYIKEYIKK